MHLNGERRRGDAVFLFQFDNPAGTMPFHNHLGHHAIEAVLTMLDSQTPGGIIDGRQRHFIIGPFGILQSGNDERIVINKANAATLFQSS